MVVLFFVAVFFVHILLFFLNLKQKNVKNTEGKKRFVTCLSKNPLIGGQLCLCNLIHLNKIILHEDLKKQTLLCY